MENHVKRWNTYSNDHTLGQFLRYAVVGGGAALIDILIYSIGTSVLGINHLLSNTVSFAAGLIFNYQLSCKWVFSQKADRKKTDFMLFSFIGIIGLLLSSLLLFLLVNCRVLFHLLSSSNENIIKPTAKIITVLAVFFWNFSARKKIVFTA